MHHMRVTLHRHQLRHADGSICSDTPDVVALQIDKHNMLGDLLFAPAKLRLHGGILRGSQASAPGAGDWPCAHFVPVQLDEQLR
ncbi:hypothetical protein D3C71_1627740 [compost metagenome]